MALEHQALLFSLEPLFQVAPQPACSSRTPAPPEPLALSVLECAHHVAGWLSASHCLTSVSQACNEERLDECAPA